MTADSVEILLQYHDPIDGKDYRLIVDSDVDSEYGVEHEVITQAREPGGAWESTQTGFAADLEIQP